MMNTTFTDDLLREAEQLGFGDIHLKLDPTTGLQAIIAIHSIKRGPALGGCRCIEYTCFADAFRDALRLARGMSYKAAITDLPLGGGKAVLMKPKYVADREAYFKAFGRFVDELSGRYITAMDSGTTVMDMEAIATSTSYVTTLARHNGDPAPFTALGVVRGIQAAVYYQFKRQELAGLHVAIQGVGHVGYNLAKQLHEQGVKLTVCDQNPAAVARCVEEFGAEATTLTAIYSVACDIFAPCALGAIVNDVTLPQLRCKILAGSANNQLAEQRHGQDLKARGILYAPDFLINAGGLIHALAEYQHSSMELANDHINHIYDNLLAIFARSDREQISTSEVADVIAAERL